MNATLQLHHIRRLMVKRAHLSPGMAFSAGLMGGPSGAAMHGATEHNGTNEAARSLLMATLLGGAGALGGGVAGVGAGKLMTRKYLREVTPAIGSLTRMGARHTEADPEVRQIVAKLIQGATGGAGAFLGGGVGASVGSGLGAMQSAREHNNLNMPFLQRLKVR